MTYRFKICATVVIIVLLQQFIENLVTRGMEKIFRNVKWKSFPQTLVT